MTPEIAGSGGVKGLFGASSFRRLWAAQFSSVSATYALNLAGIVLVEEQTHSSARTGLAIASAILSAFLFSLVAGAVVDRWGRVPVLMGSHLARAAVAVTFWMGMGMLSPSTVVPALILLNAVLAACTQFALPAELALLPDVTGEADLMPANAVIQLSILAAEGFGILILAPVVIKVGGIPELGLAAMLMCVLAAALVAGMHSEVPTPAKVQMGKGVCASLVDEVRAGWRAIAGDSILRLVTLQAALAATLLLVMLSLIPGLAARHLGLAVEDSSYLLLPGGVGFLLGSVAMGRWGGRWNRTGWIGAGMMGMGVGLGLMSLFSGGAESPGTVVSPLVEIALFETLVLGLGLMLSLVIIPARTELQERPPADMRGRVIAAQLALGNAGAVLPLFLGGAMADSLGMAPVMGLMGALAVGAGLAGLFHGRGGRS